MLQNLETVKDQDSNIVSFMMRGKNLIGNPRPSIHLSSLDFFLKKEGKLKPWVIPGSPDAGVLVEPCSAKRAQRSSYTVSPGYKGWTEFQPLLTGGPVRQLCWGGLADLYKVRLKLLPQAGPTHRPHNQCFIWFRRFSLLLAITTCGQQCTVYWSTREKGLETTVKDSCREYCMIYRVPGFLAVAWSGSSPPPPPSPVDTQEA